MKTITDPSLLDEALRRALDAVVASEGEAPRFVNDAVEQYAAQAALWYWLYGVPYCPGCVTSKTPCLSQEEAARAARETVPAGTRCHCCGKPGFSFQKCPVSVSAREKQGI